MQATGLVSHQTFDCYVDYIVVGAESAGCVLAHRRIRHATSRVSRWP